MFINLTKEVRLLPKKTYVLDASVLLSAGRKALFAFEDNNIIIPISVIQTLEDRKTDSQLGFTARSVLKEIEKLRKKGIGDLGDYTAGVPLNDQGGTLAIELNHTSLDRLKDFYKIKINNDQSSLRVLAVALSFQDELQIPTTLVSNSLPLRIKAETIGLEAEEFYGNRIQSQGYSGYYDEVQVPSTLIDKIFKSAEHQNIVVPEKYFASFGEMPSNFGAQFVDGKNKVLGLVTVVKKNNGQKAYHVKKSSYKKNYGNSRFTPGSPEQYLAADYITSDNDIKILSIGGAAGTGKTALTLAVGFEEMLENVMSREPYDTSGFSKVIVFRPMTPVGNQEYGFLPGNEEEKMDPWAAAVYDALQASTSMHTVKEVKAEKRLEVLPVTHIRGRTFDNSLIVVDEAQNLESIVLLSVLARAGKNSKVVFLWDANQRDNLNISKDDGIVNIIEHFKHTPEFAHIEFTKSERSVIAELANEAIEKLGL